MEYRKGSGRGLFQINIPIFSAKILLALYLEQNLKIICGSQYTSLGLVVPQNSLVLYLYEYYIKAFRLVHILMWPLAFNSLYTAYYVASRANLRNSFI
jgi:hypothetical protein